jgi:hypothetical protein
MLRRVRDDRALRVLQRSRLRETDECCHRIAAVEAKAFTQAEAPDQPVRSRDFHRVDVAREITFCPGRGNDDGAQRVIGIGAG